jgi:HK97 family phage major capsid protein
MADNFDIKNVHEGVNALRETVESIAKKYDSIDVAKIEKINAYLDKQEEKSQALEKELAEAKKSRESLDIKLDDIEKSISKLPSGGSEEKDALKVERDLFLKFIKTGAEEAKNELNTRFVQHGANGSPEVLKYLSTDKQTAGGVLVPVTYINQLVKKVTEISALRPFCTVRQMGPGSTELPVETGLPTSYWAGEGAPSTDSEGTFGKRTFKAHRLTTQTTFTADIVMDSYLDIEAILYDQASRSRALKEGTAFVKGTGDGTNQPLGLMVSSEVAEVNAGSTSAITADKLIYMTGQLASEFQPRWGLNRKTIAYLRTLKNSGGNEAYIWQPGNISAGVPNQILGLGYTEIPDMDDIASAAYPIVLGDFSKYMIGDRMMLDVVRDTITKAGEAKVIIYWRSYVAGGLMQPEAFLKLKMSV